MQFAGVARFYRTILQEHEQLYRPTWDAFQKKGEEDGQVLGWTRDSQNSSQSEKDNCHGPKD